MKFPEAFCITGTDTDVGKTVIAALITAGLQAAYWKPVQCGLTPRTDTEMVHQLTGLPDSHFLPETYSLKLPMSPHAAAEDEGVEIKLNNFKLPIPPQHRPLVVEGAGGIMVPINDRHYMLDLMHHLGLPIVLVTRSTLGTINHTLLSLNCLRRAGLKVLGLVINGPKNNSNRKALEFYGKVEVLAEVEKYDDLEKVDLEQEFKKLFCESRDQ